MDRLGVCIVFMKIPRDRCYKRWSRSVALWDLHKWFMAKLCKLPLILADFYTVPHDLKLDTLRSMVAQEAHIKKNNFKVKFVFQSGVGFFQSRVFFFKVEFFFFKVEFFFQSDFFLTGTCDWPL